LPFLWIQLKPSIIIHFSIDDGIDIMTPSTHSARSYIPFTLLFLLSILSLASCQSVALNAAATPIDGSISATKTLSASATLLPSPDSYTAPFSIWVNPDLPAPISDAITDTPTLSIAATEAEAEGFLSTEGNQLVGYWTYLAVVPFHSLRRSISSSDLRDIWENGPSELSGISSLFITPETLNVFRLIWGEPGDDAVNVIEAEDFQESAWPVLDSVAIIPFGEINPIWIVLEVDGVFPLGPDFTADKYVLNVPLFLTAKEVPLNIIADGLQLENFDRSKLTSVALTGVTALVRDTAAIMEEKGITYPAGDIAEILRSADITHISNEVPFAVNCPPPDPNQPSLYFCSNDSYIALLADVGTDIVELSGDHFGDWGPEAMLHSLDLYHAQGWLTYGGGKNLQSGLEPVFIEHNGNRIAFIGCNGKVHDKYATATDTNPGASRCDFDYMQSEIANLHQQGYLVIATMQHEEVDSYAPIAIQLYDFRRLADAGADIVSGSQAHHPQTFEYTGSSFIHYGLGNLFFDQWYLAHYNPEEHADKDKAFIDLHYFYNGSYINTRLVPILFIDNARPRLMTPEESELFLTQVYKSAIWNKRPLPGYLW
jgi:hypothetical protein